MNNNNLYKRPMFRKGGSAEGGITSGLSTPKRGMVDGPGSYAGIDMNQNISQFLKNASLGDQKKLVDQMYPSSDGTRRPQRRFNDFLIDFGLDIASRPAEGNIFQTAATAAKEPFQTFQAATLANQQDERDRTEDIFGTALASEYDLEAQKNKKFKELGADNRKTTRNRSKYLLGMHKNK